MNKEKEFKPLNRREEEEMDYITIEDKEKLRQEGKAQTIKEIEKDYKLLLEIKYFIKRENAPIPTLKLNDRIDELKQLLSSIDNLGVEE